MRKYQTNSRLGIAEFTLVAIIIGMIMFIGIYVRNVKNNTSDLYQASSATTTAPATSPYTAATGTTSAPTGPGTTNKTQPNVNTMKSALQAANPADSQSEADMNAANKSLTATEE